MPRIANSLSAPLLRPLTPDPRPLSLVWFRQDLRLADNPALAAAIARGGPVMPVFIWQPDEEGAWPAGAAGRWWLHQSLEKLSHSLEQVGSKLIIRRGETIADGGTLAALEQLIEETGASAVYWNRRYEPAIRQRDTRIEGLLRQRGIACESCNSALLFDPDEVATQQGKPFQVFTPFWKHCLARRPPEQPLAAPARIQAPIIWPSGLPLVKLSLEPSLAWAAEFPAAWQPGETAAQRRLHEFLDQTVLNYRVERDHPSSSGTSRLSPHLHFGEISPRQIWHEAKAAVEAINSGEPRAGFTSAKQPAEYRPAAEFYLREVGWREFAYHLLVHFPHTSAKCLREAYDAFPWTAPNERLQAWQRGRTGYPIVDAGMRELWTTGWMHNRVRMIAASFLVKDLLISWTHGASWFWDTLVDADLANNTLGWQWTAGCGADAAPFFRIFNPVLQGEKFDPRGAYVRRWVPELAELPDQWIHRPWEAPTMLLKLSGVRLGENYPAPIVDHAAARQAALSALRSIRAL